MRDVTRNYVVRLLTAEKIRLAGVAEKTKNDRTRTAAEYEADMLDEALRALAGEALED